MSLSGDYWLTPNGELVSIAGSEHANIAKIEMLGLKGRDRVKFARLGRHFNAITPEEVETHRERGVPEDVLQFLTSGPSVDPRLWAMREWNWVRIHPGVFNVWVFDDELLERIKGAHNYWSMQRDLMDEYEMVTLNEESTGNMLYIPVKALLNAGSTVEGLKYLGERGERARFFRNPPRQDWAPHCRGDYLGQLREDPAFFGYFSDDNLDTEGII